MSKHWTRLLPRGACSDGVAWARTQPDAQTAWDNCERGDWMLWLLGCKAGRPWSDARKRLVLCACDCAARARKFTSGDSRRAFDRCQRTARSWARGHGATASDVVTAADAAAAAAADAAAFAAAYAVDIAASALATAAASAADTADYASSAALAAYALERRRLLARCARIVRKHYPRPPIPTAKRGADA